MQATTLAMTKEPAIKWAMEEIVHIIDDDKSQRAALDCLLRSMDLKTRCYPSVAAFLDTRRTDAAGCLVLDVRMPGTNGLDFQAKLAGLGIYLPVVLMSGHGDVPMTVRGMKAGAVDFLTKPFRDQDMLDAVTAALERDKQRRSIGSETAALRAKYTSLSPREQQVMHLVAAGLMNKQVAGELGLSEITVKIHRGAAMHKMGARTLAELVRMVDALAIAGVPTPRG
jgi:FixJ family two-component response regulator